MQPVVFVIMILIVALFTTMTGAYLFSNKLRIEIDAKQRPFVWGVIQKIIDNPSLYMSTLLVGGVLSIVLSVFFGMQMFGPIIGEDLVWLTLSLIIIAIFTFGIGLPYAISKANPNSIFILFSLPIYILTIILYPISKIALFISILVLRMFGVKEIQDPVLMRIDKDDFVSLVEEASGQEGGDQTTSEMKLLQNVLDFSDLRVRDCMTPRVEIQAIDVNDSIENLANLIGDSHFSRIPVYEGTIDNVIGYASARGLFTRPQNIREILMEMVYVPESGMVDKLMERLIKTRKTMAIVIDEFGGTTGLITIEDILEEIFGEIEDEHDADRMIEKQVSENSYIFSGRLEISYLNEEYGFNIPESDEYETLAGLILYENDSIPKVGQEFEIAGIRLVVEQGSESKISVVKLILIN